jgi:thiamine-monophosphate kinase
MSTESLENIFIENLVAGLPRSPMQVNRLQQCDAELVRLTGDPDQILAITTDSLVEEIDTGLYESPWLIGWMIVMANLSDLAAVGASPLGIVISEVLPREFQDVVELQRGIRDACIASEVCVLGGDTNFADRLIVTACAVGTVRGSAYLSRQGCVPGDVLYSSGPLGSGNAFALARFMKDFPPEGEYRPTARIREGKALIGVASACMDTSDGLFATLDQLTRVNHVGFELDAGWESALDPGAKAMADGAGIPPWLMLAGEHGEFELVFTVPQERESALLEKGLSLNRKFYRLGKVTETPVVTLPVYGAIAEIDTGRIRNLPGETGGNVERYLHELLGIDASYRRKLTDL